MAGYFDMTRYYKDAEDSENRIAIRPWEVAPNEVIELAPQIYVNDTWQEYEMNSNAILINREDVAMMCDALQQVASFMESRQVREHATFPTAKLDAEATANVEATAKAQTMTLEEWVANEPDPKPKRRPIEERNQEPIQSNHR